MEGHTNNVVAVGYPNHQKWLYTASEDGSLKVWDTRENKSQRNPTIHEKKKVMLTCAVLHPNQGEIVVGDQSGTISIYELRADKIRTQWKPENKAIPIRSVTMASFSHMLIVANNKGTCYVYEPSHQISKGNQTNENENESKTNTNANDNASNNNDGVTIVQSNAPADKNGMYYLTHKIAAHDTYCLKCLLSPDCKFLATSSSDQTIKVFEVTNNFKMFNRLVGHRKWVWDMAFSADSAYLVSGMFCFALYFFHYPCALLYNSFFVFCICFYGVKIASSDTTSKLWDLKSGQAIVHYDEHNKGVTCVALNDSS